MKKSAHDTYLERHAEVMAKVEKVKIMLETHAMHEAVDQSNWGFAGDLGYYINQLGQILGEEG